MNTSVTERVGHFDGRRIFLREAGTGPLVLLLHGWPEGSYAWRHQIEALAEAGYHAVAYDGLGYGRSSKPPHVVDYRMAEQIDVAVGLTRALGEEEAHLVGHDWGAIVAWTAAWTRPDVFSSIVALSLPFAGRGQFAFPGSPFGEERPSAVDRRLAGPGKQMYKEYFNLVGRTEAEFDSDVTSWLRGFYVGSSAPANPTDADRVVGSQLNDEEMFAQLQKMGIIFPEGIRLGDGLALVKELPSWISQEEFDHFVAEYERTGFWGPLNWYRNVDINWEALAAYEGKPVTVPALFIGAEFDAPTIWGHEAIARMHEHVTDLRGQIIVKNVGHYIQGEAPEEVNAALIGFLKEVAPTA